MVRTVLQHNFFVVYDVFGCILEITNGSFRALKSFIRNRIRKYQPMYGVMFLWWILSLFLCSTLLLVLRTLSRTTSRTRSTSLFHPAYPGLRPVAMGVFLLTLLLLSSLPGLDTPDLARANMVQPVFEGTSGQMAAARYEHTATLLPDGTVLIVGGYNPSSTSPVLNTAELYDPTTGMFSATAHPMTSARRDHTATLLPDGTVLLAGGLASGSFRSAINTAEIYDPKTGMFTATRGAMSEARFGHTATLFADKNGKQQVLLTGAGAAESYDPVSQAFARIPGKMQDARIYATATLLPDGTVLIAGGYDATTGALLNTAELYHPLTETFTQTKGEMNYARAGHTATLLSNGVVLITGGKGAGHTSLNTTEVYNPSTGTFSPASTMISARANHTGTPLPDGTVLIAGGGYFTATPLVAELYHPSTGTFSPAGNMVSARMRQTATPLSNGTVLLVGGYDGSTGLNSAEIYGSLPIPHPIRSTPSRRSLLPLGGNATHWLERVPQLDSRQYDPSGPYTWARWAYSTCSAAAMAAVMNAYRKEAAHTFLNPYRVADVLRVEAGLGEITVQLGLVSGDGIAKTAAHFGFRDVQSDSFTLDQVIAIAKAGRPVIVGFPPSRYEGGHLIVVAGGDSQTVRLVDSSGHNWQNVSRTQFLAWWGGGADVLYPA